MLYTDADADDDDDEINNNNLFKSIIREQRREKINLMVIKSNIIIINFRAAFFFNFCLHFTSLLYSIICEYLFIFS